MNAPKILLRPETKQKIAWNYIKTQANEENSTA